MIPPTSPLLQFQAVSLVRDDGSILVDRLSLDVHRAEIVALVGESGSGKTLAARAALGLLPHGVRQSAGQILFEGQDLRACTVEQFRRLRGQRMGLVLQEPLTALNPAMTIGDQLVEGLLRDGAMKPREARDRAAAMLERVSIRGALGLLERYPHEFSGGMRQRIMLASVFLTEPDLIIADEPTTALDTITQREVLDLMVGLGADLNVAVLLITHNLGLAARYAHRVAVMQTGCVVESGPAREVLTAPSQAYTRALVAAVPRFASPQGDGSAAVSARVTAGSPILEITDLTVGYGPRGWLRSGPSSPVLDRVNLKVGAGEIVAVVGGSGCGKTTLGRTVMGMVAPRSGEIRFEGRVLGQRRDRDFRARTQMVFQDPFSSLNPRQRIHQIVGDPLRHEAGMGAEARRLRAAEMLDQVGLGKLLDRFPHQLSGGQRQRVAIARALIRDPRLIIADEPTSALDVTVQAQVLSLLREIQADRGFACLFISHDLGVVSEIASRIVILDQGRVVEEGPCWAILTSPTHPHTAALVAATPHI